MIRPLVIIGAGGFGREVFQLVSDINRDRANWHVLGFVADGHRDSAELAVLGAADLGPVDAFEMIDACYVLGIGNNHARQAIDERVSAWSKVPATLVHPSASIGSTVALGPGSVVAAGARLTTNIVTGRHCNFHLNSNVGHDCRLGDYVTLNPGASVGGHVNLGHRTTIATNATVLPDLMIGDDVMVGAGAVVLKPVEAGQTVVGVPARPIVRLRA
jgi:sugar O-acyltransferase (sialic acid O-acetyltransferase NeuD family)